MSALDSWQVLADCERCFTESGVTELHTAEGAGVPVLTRCSACGHHQEDGECREQGADMADPDLARASLTRWATDEGVDLETLCRGSMGLDAEAVLALYGTRSRVETSLDVMAFLFPGSVAGSAGAVEMAAPEVSAEPVQEPVSEDRRAAVKLLVSVMVADGVVRQVEVDFVRRFVEAHGFEPVQPSEMRPWRLHELGPLRDAALAAAAVEAAVELMHLDGQRDGSEMRMVRTYARVWGVPEADIAVWDAKYDRRYAPRFGRVWSMLSRWVR